MVNAVVMSYQDASDTYGAAVRAGANLGSDGPSNGSISEYGVGGRHGQEAFGRRTWASGAGTNGEWDSGWVTVQLVVKSDGTTQWSVDGGSTSTLSYDAGGVGAIHEVELVATTQAHAKVQWGDVQITFSHANSQVDQYTASGDSPAVDTTATDDDHMTAQQTMLVSTDASNVDEVVITGEVRFTTAYDMTALSPWDMSVDAMVFAGSAA